MGVDDAHVFVQVVQIRPRAQGALHHDPPPSVGESVVEQSIQSGEGALAFLRRFGDSRRQVKGREL